MTKGRIEAFSDGVIAIIITIMVLELHVPHGHEWADFKPLVPILFCYVLSFANVGIYWNNHHHMFHAVRNVGGWVLWANLHLLFWLSLMPFVTGLIGENDFVGVTVFLYTIDLLMCGVAYYLLVQALISQHGQNSEFARMHGNNRKEVFSVVAYVLALLLTFFLPIVSIMLIALVAVIWVVPDPRFSRQIQKE
ncbi:DUF1211 domain-containing protein [bacterium]|nr:DUF1211 domain-containing protein [bacterium]